MTQQLSPAAQAVFDSYKAASDGCYSGGEWLQNEAGQIAAALRAAVAQTQRHPGHDIWQCDADDLLAIAAELEAQ